MLIGLDAISLTRQKAGVGHYTRELARALAAASPADDFDLVYPAHAAPRGLADEAAEGAPPNMTGGAETDEPPNLRAAPVRAGLLARRKWSLGLRAYARRRRPALFHGTNYVLPFACDCPTVLTVHDLSAFLHPSTHAPRVARALRRRLPFMARAADAIITPTEAVRREACEILRVDPSKVFAVPEAPRAVFRPLARGEALTDVSRLGVGRDFILAVGTVEPRKNLPTLLRAFELLLESDSRKATTGVTKATAASAAGSTETSADDLQLVVAGKVGWLSEELFARVAASPSRGRVRFVGYVSDEELRALYSACLAFVYPSLYEGFGLPPLEAMACGAPVVASRASAVAEVTGGAARLFDPSNTEELTCLLLELLDDEAARRALSEAGLRRARDFSWEKTARATLDVYREALLSARAR